MRYLRQPPSPEEQQERTNQWADYWEKKRLDDQRVNWLESTPLGHPEPITGPQPQSHEDLRWESFLKRTLPEWYLKVHYPNIAQQTQQLRDIWTDDREEQLPL
jgi:hypothetical protein